MGLEARHCSFIHSNLTKIDGYPSNTPALITVTQDRMQGIFASPIFSPSLRLLYLHAQSIVAGV